MSKVKKIFTNFRVLLLLAVLILSIVAISPDFNAKGVAIRSVSVNSSASLAGIESPAANSPPMSREVIVSINNQDIGDINDFNFVASSLPEDVIVTIKTSKDSYLVDTSKGNELGLKVYDAPSNNVRMGLDLQGGTRVLLQPVEKVDADVMSLTLENMKERLNVYGISDLIVREASDLSGNQYILAEIAGMNEEEVRDLLAQQGKFEAKIGNDTVFYGGQKDIVYVCRSADCSGIDPTKGCSEFDGGYACTFRFSITLKPEAAERQAAITEGLEIIYDETSGQEYLSEDLTLYLDDASVDSLKIGADLKGRAVTDIQISGSGSGTTQPEAMQNSLEQMKRLQTIIITGSLPVKLDVVKVDVISPALGSEFIKESLLVALLAIAAIIIIIFIKYRTLNVVIPMALITIIEVVLILGLASIIGWEMDLAAIAGILIAVGTGIDHQIIIADETIKGKETSDWKRRLKGAFFIIIGAYLTTIVAMLPLLGAGAGLLKGFALTTILGTTIGVLISRPAYGRIIEILVKD